MNQFLKVNNIPQRRVVLTGMSLLTGLGLGVQTNWEKILATQSGVDFMRGPSTYSHGPVGSQFPKECYTEEFLDEYGTKHVDDPFFAMANYVVKEALQSSNLLDGPNKIKEVAPKDRIGLITSTMFYNLEVTKRLPQLQAKDILMCPPYGQAHILALEYNLEGYVRANSNACSSSLKSIGDGYRMIKDGQQDVMICGGFDQNMDTFPDYASNTQLGVIVKAEDPKRSSRPFDSRAVGTVMGDGGAFVVLETLEGAIARGAPIICEIHGFDCFYSAETLLRPSVEGIQRAITSPIIEAGWKLKDVDLVNPHGSGTAFGNKVETRGMKSVFCTPQEDFEKGILTEDWDNLDLSLMSNLSVSSLKGYIGHLNLSSGAAETVISIKMLLENTVVGTFGLEQPYDETLPMPKEGEYIHRDLNKLIKYTMGFGGNMAGIAIEKHVKE